MVRAGAELRGIKPDFRISKKLIPVDIFIHINNAFMAIDLTKDKSTLIKRSLNEMYEDLIDRKAIKEYETREKGNDVTFVTAEEIINMLKNPKNAV